MPKYKIKKKECQLIVNVKLLSGERINDIEFNAFSRKYIRGFLKGNCIRKFGKNLVEYTGPIGISLHEYLKKPLEKKDFLFMIEQIVDMNQKLDSNALRKDCVIWDINYVFINEATRELQFIYLPLEQKPERANVQEMIDRILYSVSPAQEQNKNYISEFAYFLNGMDQFDLNKIEYFVMKEDSSVVKTIKKHAAGQSGYITDKRSEYLSHYREEEDDEKTGLLEDDEATGLLKDEEATGLLLEEDDNETTLLSQEEETGLLVEETRPHYPYLIRESNGERIEINKQVFRIGKERSYVDYFVMNNNAVSRSHADIITRGNQYFVKDLNSKNRTFINTRAIPVEQEMELLDADRLCLANEEFTFYTK